MNHAFSMKELWNIAYFLGISVQSTGDSDYFVSQHQYGQDILTKAGMANCKHCASPIVVKPFLSPNVDLSFDNLSLYRSIVKALQYLTITRPDLSLAVNQSCQHMHALTFGHFSAVKRLLRYVQGTIAHGLTYQPSTFDLHAFFDSNWTEDVINKKSTSGYCIFLGSNLISWSLKKQATVSRSSTEVEYRALAHVVAELTWVKMFLQDLAISSPTLPILWCDNVSSIALASNSVFHSRSKHIKVDCHFVRDKVLAKQLTLQYIPTQDQLADIFTKPLSVACFLYLKSKLMEFTHPISLQGHVENTTASTFKNTTISKLSSEVTASKLNLEAQSMAQPVPLIDIAVASTSS
ncbi:uncharacterized protein LOC114311544 [Camellia sinensis]|uniref:uncharacterized protein LOC114311544 n=1 Tax=Camellia sinensis TaxID=4442 RepID=UPI0010359E9E|nr:uncharacterized protein LOC114311544 [Camellia sinensis]